MVVVTSDPWGGFYSVVGGGPIGGFMGITGVPVGTF